MIDLHMHTTYSDGTDSVKELLSNASKIDLEVISITDHDTLDSYYELDKLDISSIYNGDIIVGCEFTTYFQEYIIEVLGYGFDYKRVKEFLLKYYNEDKLKKKHVILGDRLIKILTDKRFVIDLDNCIIHADGYSYYGIKKTYKEILEHSENKDKIDKDIFDSISNFVRKGVYNIHSDYYLGYMEFFPSLEEIVGIVHDAGGKLFLAHPYMYGINDVDKFLNEIYDEYEIDGIECFYATFDEKQTRNLVDFARKRNLLVSGGSDYHVTNKQNHDLGIGKGNLNISKDIISNWNIDYNKK